MCSLRCCVSLKQLNSGIVVSQGKKVAGFGAYQCRTKYDSRGSCKEIDQLKDKKLSPWLRPDTQPTVTWQCGYPTDCPAQPPPPNYDPYKIKVPNVLVPPLPPSNAKPAIECVKLKGPCSVKPPPPGPPCPPPPPKPFPWIYVWSTALFLTTFGVLYKLFLLRERWSQSDEGKPVWRPRPKIKKPYHCEDLPPCVQYLIVGTGIAAWSAYKAIMEHDPVAKVFFVTKDDVTPYIRPPMSKQMWFNQAPPDLENLYYLQDMKRYTMYLAKCPHFMDPVKFYRKPTGPAVSLAAGWCVLRVDPDDHRVWIKTMCGEQPMYYERCLLAPGVKPKQLRIFKSAPKAVREKICTLRSLRDLEVAFRSVKAAKSVVVVGGGILGTELAYYIGRMPRELEKNDDDPPPVQVTHVIKDKGILSGVLPEYLGEWAAERVKCENVKLVPNAQVYDAFETPDGRLELTLSNGTSLVTDYMFVAIGSNVRDELAEPSELELDDVNGGFKVNTEMEARTHLYVAGDAASFFTQWKRRRLRCEHYDNALQSGAIAGANMTGFWTPCNMEPHYWLRLEHDIEMEIVFVEVVGEVGACMPTVALFKQCTPDEMKADRLEIEDQALEKPCYKNSMEYKVRYKRGILFYLREETVVGIVFWNLPPIEDRRDVAQEILRAQPSYKEINLLAELLGFHEAECPIKPPDQIKEEPLCITKYVPNK